MDHTPGPWKWTHGQYKSGEWVSSLDAASDDGVLFHCAFWPIRDANARLIAVAPEQNAALIVALEWWHSDYRHMQQKEPAWVPLARAAIAKARG